MVIPRPDQVQGPRPGTFQPMVRFCPGCQGHLEVLASRNQQEFSHNYWCTVCGRIFEINYLDREFNLDEPWIEAATEARRGENET